MVVTPVLGFGPFRYAVIEPVAMPAPARRGAVPAPRPPRVPPRRTAPLTASEAAWVEVYTRKLDAMFSPLEFDELLELAPDRALAVLDRYPLSADVAALRGHRGPGALERHLRALGLVGEEVHYGDRIATMSKILCAHGRAQYARLDRDDAEIVRTLGELAHAAGLDDVHFERTEHDDASIVSAYTRGERYDLVSAFEDVAAIAGLLNTLARALRSDVVFAVLELGLVAWGPVAAMVRATSAGLFGFDGTPRWEAHVPLVRLPRADDDDDDVLLDEDELPGPIHGELTPAVLELVRRAGSLARDALIVELEVAAAAGVRRHRDWPREIEVSARYDAERATIELGAVAVVAEVPRARNEISIARARELSDDVTAGDELVLGLAHAADWWFELPHARMRWHAEYAVIERLAGYYLPPAIATAAAAARRPA